MIAERKKTTLRSVFFCSENKGGSDQPFAVRYGNHAPLLYIKMPLKKLFYKTPELTR